MRPRSRPPAKRCAQRSPRRAFRLRQQRQPCFRDGRSAGVCTRRATRSSPDAAAHMSVDGLRDALRQRYAALGGSLAMLEKRFVADDPTGRRSRCLRSCRRRRRRGATRRLVRPRRHARAAGSADACACFRHARAGARPWCALDAAFARSRGAAALRVELLEPRDSWRRRARRRSHTTPRACRGCDARHHRLILLHRVSLAADRRAVRAARGAGLVPACAR